MAGDRPRVLVVLGAVNLIAVAALCVMVFSAHARAGASGADIEEQTRLAAAFANRGLYQAAEGAIRRVVDSPSADNERKAAALLQLGTWYLEQGKDDERALAAFVELRERFPESSVAKDAAKKEVACLDRLGRPMDAKGVLDETAPVDAQKAPPREGLVLAKVGDREITSGDLDAEIRRLPAEVQKQFTDKNQKRQLLQSLIARELLTDSAVSQGLDKDPEVLRSLADAKKAIMTGVLIDRETADKVRVDDVDIKNAYDAHKEKLKDKDGNPIPFDKAALMLRQQLQSEKQNAAVQSMVEDLAKSRSVQIFDERL